MDELIKIGYIGLNKPCGGLMLNVPVYIKVEGLNKNGMTDEQERVIHSITETMLQCYEKQLSEYFASLKAE